MQARLLEERRTICGTNIDLARLTVAGDREAHAHARIARRPQAPPEVAEVADTSSADTQHEVALLKARLRGWTPWRHASNDHAIAQVKADGTYDRIRAKYFSFDIK